MWKWAECEGTERKVAKVHMCVIETCSFGNWDSVKSLMLKQARYFETNCLPLVFLRDVFQSYHLSLHVQLLFLVTDTRNFVMFYAAKREGRTLPADEADNVHLIVGFTQVHRTSDC
jgi:hypothetical protein